MFGERCETPAIENIPGLAVKYTVHFYSGGNWTGIAFYPIMRDKGSIVYTPLEQ